MKTENSQTDITPHINITPLIDVLLVLLIIFMVVSPLKPARFIAKIPAEPKIDDGVRPNDDSIITVKIEKNLHVKLNMEEFGTANDTGNLSAKLTQVFQEREENGVFKTGTTTNEIEKTVFIRAPRALAYGDVVKVVDAVKGAGATPIGLQIDDLTE